MYGMLDWPQRKESVKRVEGRDRRGRDQEHPAGNMIEALGGLLLERDTGQPDTENVPKN